MENNLSTLLNDSPTNKVKRDLQELAKDATYDSIRFFIAPDKNVSTESVLEDAKAFFEARKTGKGIVHVKTFSINK